MIRLLIRYLLFLCFYVATFHNASAQPSKIDSLRVILKTLPADTNRVNVLIALCNAQSYYDSRKIFPIANEALALSEKINFNVGRGKAYSQLGYYFHKTGDDLKAVESLHEASNIFEEINNSTQAAYACNDIGVIYNEQGDEESALIFFTRANSLWSKVNFRDGMCLALLNLGSAYESLKKDSLALLHYEQALDLSQKINNEIKTGKALFGIGAIYLRKKDYVKSLFHERKALNYFVKADMGIMQSKVYNILSQIYLNQDQPAEALRMAERAMRLSEITISKDDLKESYYRASKACEKLKDYPRAYKLQSLYVILSDSLRNLKSKASIEKLSLRHKLDKKESEMALLIQQNQVADSRRNIFVIILAGLLTASFLLYNRYRLVTQKRLRLKRQQLNLFTQSLLEKSETIKRISNELELLKSYNTDENIQIAKIDKILQSNILTDEDWNSFKTSFNDIFPAFFSKLKYICPTITTSELRLCSLIKLKLSIKEMASMLGISPESVKTSRYRLKKKLDLAENETIEEFIERLGVFYNRGEIKHMAEPNR